MFSLANLTLQKRIGLLVIVGLAIGLGLFSWLGVQSVNKNVERTLAERLTMARHYASHLDETLSFVLAQLQDVNFSAADFPQKLEQREDFYFWTLSEGRLSKGMPLYKSSLSEEQCWQLLTYLWSLNITSAPPKETTPPAKPPLAEEGSTLLLTAPEQAQTGQPMTLSAALKNSQGEPIEKAPVKFFIKVDFFASGLMEIGDASTNEQGIATIEYTPRITGDNQVIASYDGIETTTTLTVMGTEGATYHPEVGIHLPAPGEEVFVGPESASRLEEGGKAPASAFRLPGGIFSWLLLFIAIIMLVWSTYFRVIYQVLRIPIVGEITDTDTRLIPRLGLVYVVIVGTLLVLFIITGPYTHFHLFR